MHFDARDDSRLPYLTLLVVALLWSFALFVRHSPYTPDEPREFDIAWNMLTQTDKAVPLLAGEPFCEKPPLTYWAAALSMKLFGPSVPAARAPNLLWALLTVVCLMAWTKDVTSATHRNRAMVFTALAGGTMLMLFRVQIWFATDAPMVAMTAVALLGAWRGLNASTRRAKLFGYLLFHAGLAGSFFAKNVLGWLVPVLALLGFIVWERRWRELLRWELYAGVLLQAVLIAPWIVAVAHHADGAHLLRIFLLDNTLGRFLPMATEEHYQLGHHNHPGKYLKELPYYLIPWTFATIAALGAAWRSLRRNADETQRRAARFALLTAIPALVLLSFSHTARDVYAAPNLLGFVMLLALWSGSEQTRPLDRWCIGATSILAWLVGLILIALGCIGLTILPTATFAPAAVGVAACICIAIAVLVARLRIQPQWSVLRGMTVAVGLYACAVMLAFALLFPGMDRAQDLRPTARAVAAQFTAQQLAILRDDETMRAYLDFGGGIAATNVRGMTGAVEWLNANPRHVLLIQLYTDHLSPQARAQLGRWNEKWAHLAPRDDDATAATLLKRGATLVAQYSVPGGRTYGVLAGPVTRSTASTRGPAQPVATRAATTTIATR